MSDFNIELYKEENKINSQPPEIIIEIGDDTKSQLNTNVQNIDIEITGLKTINSFISLTDTPLYYENGKFFKVENNKIIYTDINWSDIQGEIETNPVLKDEITKIVQDYSSEYLDTAVKNKIDEHDNNENAHQFIQDLINNNIIEINKNILDITTNVTTNAENISELETDLNNTKNEYNTKFEEIDNNISSTIGDLSDLSAKVQTNTSNIEGLNTNLSNTQKEFTDKFKVTGNEISNLKENVQNINTDITGINSNIEDIDTHLSTIESKVNTNTSDIKNLSNKIDGDISSVNTNITNLTEKVNDNTSNIEKIDTRVSTNTQNISDLTKLVQDDYAELGERITFNTNSINNNSERITENTNKISANITGIANNTNEINTLKDKVNAIKEFDFIVVDSLPEIGETNHIYLVLHKEEPNNIYDEYIWIKSNNSFELIGTTSTNLSNYFNKDEINNLLNDKANINQTGNKLGYTDSKLSLEDINGNRLSEVTIKSTPDLDNKTIHLNNSNELEVYGNLTKDGTFKYDWIGTEAEYNTGVADGTITSDTLCLVTDDETELISSASGQTQILIKTTYNDLVQIKNNNKLISGAFYRITDYVTTTNGNSATTSEPSRSAGHQFDIVIQALDESNLSQIGSCSLHEGDTYFANQNINSWKIWYDIDNNINKYNWAVTDGTGKGVIYRMIDEHFNDLPYDFKNIQFYRDKTLPKYANTSSRMTVEDGYYYTFSRVYGGILTDFTLAVSYNERNTMGEYRQGNKLSLPNNIFMIASANGPLSANNFGISCYNNTVFVGSGFYNNEFTINFMNNIISSSKMTYNTALDNFDGNVIKSQCNNNVFGQYFATNTLNGSQFRANHIGHQCFDNVINNNKFIYNYINNAFHTNTISNTVFQNNAIGDNCSNNNITSGNFVYNNISGYFRNNSIGGDFLYNNISSYFRYNELNLFNYNTTGSGIQNIKLPEKTTNWEIKAGISGSSTSNKLDLTALPSGTGYTANIIRDGSGRVLYTYLSGTEIRGKYKESITSSEWKNLPITEEATT